MDDVFVSRSELERQKSIAKSLALRFDGKKAFVRSFGCQQNEADGERIMGTLLLCGFTQAADESEADLIIMNTCAIREHAEKRELSYTGQLKKLKEAKPWLLIGVCGCMPQQLHRAAEIKKSYPYVDFVFGTDMNHTLPEILQRTLDSGKRGFYISDKPHADFGVICEGVPVVRGNPYKAWVSVMYGCNNFCSYCVVPYVRGRERSRNSADVLGEVEGLVKSGCRDITLLGQNVNSYKGDISFPELLKRASEFGGEYWVRFMTSHPKDASDELIDVIANGKNIAPHFHLPVQSGSNRVLQLMNRRYTRESYIEKALKIREKIPGIAISTDIICGFPTETDEDFADTLSLVRLLGFDMIFTFIYSPRTGTAAAEMEGQIPREEQSKRFAAMSELQNEMALMRNSALIGSRIRVLSEGNNRGRSGQNKIVTFDKDVPAGEFTTVEIRFAQQYELRGIVI